MSLRQGLRLTAVVLVLTLALCAVLGSGLYLMEKGELEPLFRWELQGEELLLSMAGEEWNFSLLRLNRTAAVVQRYWILLPRGFRFGLQLLTRHFLQ